MIPVLLLIILFSAIAAVLSLPVFGGFPKSSDRLRYRSRYPYMDGDRMLYPAVWEEPLDGENVTVSNRDNTPGEILPAVTPSLDDEGYSVTWFGHSSILVTYGGKRVLIDPVFSERCSPFRFIGPKRFSKLTVKAEDLQHCDIVFITHDHYDHLDMETILALKDKVSFFAVPLGCDLHLRRWGIPDDRIRLFSWWDEQDINGIRVTCCPVRHFTGRLFVDNGATLPCSWAFEMGGKRIFASGDGSSGGHLKEIADRFGYFDLILAECGQYDPSWRSSHMYPEESAGMCRALGAKAVIPVHWGSFSLSPHPWDDPPERFLRSSQDMPYRVMTPQLCETVYPDDHSSGTSRWWRELS